MKTATWRQIGIISIAFVTQAHAQTPWKYLIDPVSCSTVQADFVRNALNGAFQMAQAGVDAAVQPSPSQSNLMGSLFGSAGPTTISNINTYLGGTTGVLGFNTEVNTNLSLDPRDIKIYCNLKRLQTRAKDLPYLYDSDIEETVRISDKTYCELHAALMYTVKTRGNLGDPSTQLQICPWLLKYAMAQKFQTHTDLSGAVVRKLATGLPGLIQKGLPGLIQKWKFTPIDILSLFDKTLLHEMTHALPVMPTIQQYQVEDVGGSFNAYGWNNCRRLSTVTTVVVDSSPTVMGPELNADTWALFGSSALLIQQGGNVYDTGTFTGPPASNSRRHFKDFAM